MVLEIKDKSYQNLGEFLLAARNKRGLMLEEVSEKSGIPIKFLRAFEHGDIRELPADVYVIGFLRKLALLYGVSASELIAQFKQERGLGALETKDAGQVSKKWHRPHLTITPKFLSAGLGVLLVLFTLFWLIWQVAGINTNPTLTIYEPKDGAVITDSFVLVKGKTDPGADLSINKKQVFVESDGSFNAVLSVSSGQKELVFESSNKFKKQAVKAVTLRVDLPVNSGQVGEQQASEELVLQIQVTKDIPISLTVDDKVEPTTVVNPAAPKTVTAKNRILLLTPDAGNTTVILNGKNLGKLGREGETLTVPFSKELINE